MLIFLLACSGGAVDPSGDAGRIDTGDSPPQDSADTDSGPPDTGETGDSPVEFDERFDVIVVGAGPAGLAAALAAREAGASVLLWDRDAEPGMGLLTGGQAFAVGTRWQEEVGVFDTIDAAKADWQMITGADPDGAGVTDFLANSGETLEWLEGYGLVIDGVHNDAESGANPRLHQISWNSLETTGSLYSGFD